MTITESPEVPPENEAMREAVRREARRRRMLVITYLSLLLLPVGVGIYAVTRAPSEVQSVARQTVPYVVPEVRKQLEPTIAATARPVIETEVRAQYERTVGPRLQSMSAATSALQATYTQLAPAVEANTKAVADLAPRIAGNAATLEQLQPLFSRHATTLDELMPAVRRHSAFVENAGPQLARLQQIDAKATAIQNEVSTALAQFRSEQAKIEERLTATTRTANANADQIRELSGQMKTLSGEIRALQRSIEELRKTCCQSRDPRSTVPPG